MEMQDYIKELILQQEELRWKRVDAEHYLMENGPDADVAEYFMSGYNPGAVWQEAWQQFGNLQYVVVFEEMAELQKEICKLIRKGSSPELLRHVAEEEADVLIMFAQLAHKYPDLLKFVDEAYVQKAGRLKQRLAEGYYKQEAEQVEAQR